MLGINYCMHLLISIYFQKLIIEVDPKETFVCMYFISMLLLFIFIVYMYIYIYGMHMDTCVRECYSCLAHNN